MTGEFLPVGCCPIASMQPLYQHIIVHYCESVPCSTTKGKATVSRFLIQARCLFCSNLAHRSTAWQCGITGWARLVWGQPHSLTPTLCRTPACALCQQDGPTQGSPAAFTWHHISSATGALSAAMAIDTSSCKLGKLFSSSSNSVFL